MEHFIQRAHRKIILSAVNLWYSRWGERSFMVLLAILIGVLAAFAAALLHYSVTHLEQGATWLADQAWSFHQIPLSLILIAILPLIGIVLSFLVQRYLGGQRYAKSLSPLILNLHRKHTSIPLPEVVTHMLSSALAVGLGGSAGLEAPSVLTGAAIGANTGSFFYQIKRRRTLLLGCGASAAISGIFGSPIAGVLFAAEVLLPEFSVSALVPLVMSSAVSAVVSRILVGDAQFFLAITSAWRTDAVPGYFLCGILCALVGAYVIRSSYFIGGLLKRKIHNAAVRILLGGGTLCLLLWLLPGLRGQGYGYIEHLFRGDLEGMFSSTFLLNYLPQTHTVLLILLLLMILLKSIAATLTVDSGGDGGIFAPSMFVGAFTGFTFARLVNLSGIVELQEGNFVAVGMCGVFTAVMRAPLTGIFLIAEVTRGYTLLVPLMIVSSVSYFVARFFEPYSIYRKALAENNILIDDRDQSMLRRLEVRYNIKRTFHALTPSEPLKNFMLQVQESHDSVFPVLDDEGHLLGIVYLQKVLTAMLNPQDCSFMLVYDFMDSPPAILAPDDDLAKAMAAFDCYKLQTLPVCDENHIFLGFLEKTPIFSKYRNMVREVDEF